MTIHGRDQLLNCARMQRQVRVEEEHVLTGSMPAAPISGGGEAEVFGVRKDGNRGVIL
jgi:hypothetical protein